MKDDIHPYLEWEVLYDPITILEVDGTKELVPEGRQEKIVINRDAHYQLRAVLFAKGDYMPKIIKGVKIVVSDNFAEPFEITGSDLYGRHYTLESCHRIGGSQSHWKSGEELLYETNLSTQGLRIRPKTETDGVWLTEWYINGPRTSSVFRNSTMRKISRTFFRERLAPDNENIHSIEVTRGNSQFSSRDYLKIEACDIRFLVTQVPKGIGPDWSSNIGIEYRKDWGRIPDVDGREAISELCSFIFGRQLLSVGYTTYDKDGNMLEGYACNPCGNPRSLCSKPDNPPIKVNPHSSRGGVDDLISRLLPPYHELRDQYRLKDALWLYWIARDMFDGTNLPLLAAAVETMMNGWFKSKRSKSRGTYMNKNKFDELLYDELSSIEVKLENKEFGDELMKRLRNAYQMGVRDRFRFFFDEISLVIDENEWAAIDARNSVAHGRITRSEEKRRQMIQHTSTYEKIIHEILLRLIGYSGAI